MNLELLNTTFDNEPVSCFHYKVSISYSGSTGFWENHHADKNREGDNDPPIGVWDDFGGGHLV